MNELATSALKPSVERPLVWRNAHGFGARGGGRSLSRLIGRSTLGGMRGEHFHGSRTRRRIGRFQGHPSKEAGPSFVAGAGMQLGQEGGRFYELGLITGELGHLAQEVGVGTNPKARVVEASQVSVFGAASEICTGCAQPGGGYVFLPRIDQRFDRSGFDTELDPGHAFYHVSCHGRSPKAAFPTSRRRTGTLRYRCLAGAVAGTQKVR